MKKVLFLLIFSCLIKFGMNAEAWCVAKPNTENQGYCSEGVDGTGKCVIIRIDGAPRCSGDQPDDGGSIGGL